MGKSLPKGWVETSIKVVSEIIRGVSYKKEQASSDKFDDSAYVIRGGNIQDNKIDFNTDDNVFVGKLLINKSQFVKENDVVIVGSTGSKKLIGKAGIATQDLENVSFGAFLMLLRTSVINKKYHSYFFQTKYYRNSISELAGGVNINNIRKEYLENLIFPLPPLAEQERIVAKLDKLFAQHEKIKKALDRIPELLKAFRQQVLTQAVTGKLTEQWREGKGLEWRIEKVRDVTNYNPRYSWDDQTCLSFVEMANLPIRLFSPLKSIKRKFIDVKKGYRRFSNSDVLLAKITPCFENGKSAVADGLLNGIGCGSSEYYVFRCKEGLLPYFLLFHFKRTVFLVEGADNMNGAVGQQRVTQEFVLNYEISIPPPQEQQEIVHRVESLFTKADAIEARYKILKAKIDSLPQAILHKAFKGELVPQLPTDGDAKDLLDEILALKKEVKGKKR